MIFSKISSDFTSDSIVAFQEDPPRRIRALKVIEDSVNLLVGTDKENINHYNVKLLNKKTFIQKKDRLFAKWCFQR